MVGRGVVGRFATELLPGQFPRQADGRVNEDVFVIGVSRSYMANDAGVGPVMPVSLTDYHLAIPESLPAGNYTFQFTTTGQSP